MDFDDKIYDTIVLFGSAGKPNALIAREIGMTWDKIQDERKVNPKLDDAFRRAEINFKEAAKAKLYSDALSGKNPGLARELYIQIQSEAKEFDNEIIIREVE